MTFTITITKVSRDLAALAVLISTMFELDTSHSVHLYFKFFLHSHLNFEFYSINHILLVACGWILHCDWYALTMQKTSCFIYGNILDPFCQCGTMVAKKATLQLLIARNLFAYRISYSRGPWRIRISRVAYSRIAYRIRAAHSVFSNKTEFFWTILVFTHMHCTWYNGTKKKRGKVVILYIQNKKEISVRQSTSA